MSNFNKVESCVKAIEAAGVNLTQEYRDWITIGLSLADLGEDGREFYHRISGIHTEYDRTYTDKKFDNFLKNKNGSITLGTFFQKSKEAGINPGFNGKQKTRPAKKVEKVENEEKWLFNVKDVLNAPREETIWSFITKGVNNAIVASSEAGKSTLLLNLAIAIAQEKADFLGWPLNASKGRSIYISTEDGIGQLKTRLTAMLTEPITDNSILFILDGRDLVSRLEKVLTEYPSDLVMIDTWGDLVGGKYDAEYTRSTLTGIKNICIEYDSTPLFVHHTNKLSENIPDKSSVKGAGDFEQACRVVMMLSIFQDMRWLACVKGNPFADDLKSICHELSFDATHQRFSRTGRQESRFAIIKELRAENLGRPSTEIDWDSFDIENIGYSDLVQKLENSGISRGTAKRKITESLKKGKLQKNENGRYNAN